MLSINVKDCENCGAINEVICKLDERVAELANKEYNSITVLSPSNNSSLIKKLIYYKSILNNLAWNSSYYCYNYKEILSRVKYLIHV